MKSLLFPTFLLLAGTVFGQATMTTSGNWATPGNWTAGNIGDNITETVTINGNVNPTVFSGTNLTVGATTLSNNNTLTINSGGTLNIGDATHANGFITNNNTVLTVAGTLVIWGDLQVNNNMTWNITGTVIIKGNVTLNNNASIGVSGGTLQVGGDFTGGNNTAVSVPSGSISVTGTVSVGSGSTLTGCAGCFKEGGSCTGPAAFCSNSILPLTLISFEGRSTDSAITLEWSTASELNFDKFVVERSGTNYSFAELGSVPGHGNTDELNEYSFNDEMPLTGMNYYRLKTSDFNGVFAHSRVIRVEFAGSGNKIKLYPNPVAGESFNVMTNFPRKDGDRIMIYNSVGALVGEKEVNEVEIKIANGFTQGMYTLSYVSGGSREVVRFLVK